MKLHAVDGFVGGLPCRNIRRIVESSSQMSGEFVPRVIRKTGDMKSKRDFYRLINSLRLFIGL